MDPRKRYSAEECLQHPWLQPGRGPRLKAVSTRVPASSRSRSDDSGKKNDGSDDGSDDGSQDKMSSNSDYDDNDDDVEYNDDDDDDGYGGDCKGYRK